MISANRDALICDLAEVYGIYNMRALPVPLLATLAVGLRDDSRIKMHLAGTKVTKTEMLLAAAVDRMSLLVWMQTEDGHKGTNRPKFVLDALIGEPDREGSVKSFASTDDFEAEWERITGVSHG